MKSNEIAHDARMEMISVTLFSRLHSCLDALDALLSRSPRGEIKFAKASIARQ
jgi:hypothetical protein